MENCKKSKTEKFVFLHKKTGKPLTLYIEANPDGSDCCGDTSVTLSEDDNYPLFAVDTLEEAIDALMYDTPWYNSTEKSPQHGRFKKEDIEIAEMTVSYKKVIFKEPLNIGGEVLDVHDLPWIVAKRLTQNSELKNDKHFVLVLIKKNSKLTIEQAREYIGEQVWSDPYNKRTLLAVIPPRDIWEELAKFEMICRCTY